MLLVVFSNAVVNPWAMMIHPFNTSQTCTAVMYLNRFKTITFPTPMWLRLFGAGFFRWDVAVGGNGARVGAHADYMRDSR